MVRALDPDLRPAEAPAPVTAAGRLLRIASYNIHSAVGLDRRCSPARIVAVLKEIDCDVLALQEVDNQRGETADSTQLEYFSQVLGMYAVPGLRIVRHSGQYGNAILSRIPVLSVERHDLSYSRYEPRGALDVGLGIGERQLRVIAVHLGLRRAERRDQWQRLMQAIAAGPPEMPTVLLGDMNEWLPCSVTLKETHRLFGEPPAPAAFPSFAPCLRLSRIWVRPRDSLLSLCVHRSRLARIASDHLPLKAVIDVDRL